MALRAVPEFKERLAKRYNETFNCFVRPQYNGAHQDFPGLHREALGIKDLYPSQKDAIWMIKLNGGAICDHEVGAGKTSTTQSPQGFLELLTEEGEHTYGSKKGNKLTINKEYREIPYIEIRDFRSSYNQQLSN